MYREGGRIGGFSTEQGVVEQEVSAEQPELNEDALRLMVADLETQVRAAELEQRPENPRGREALNSEREKVAGLLQTARETLNSFSRLQEAGGLEDPDGVRKFEEIQKLVQELERRQADIDQRIAAIPEETEEQIRHYKEVRKEYEQTCTGLNSRIDELAGDIQDLAFKKVRVQERVQDSARAVKEARDTITADFRRLADQVTDEGFKSELQRVDIMGDGDIEEGMRLLAARRESLGWFRGKEKQAIDAVVARVKALIGGEYYKKAQDQLTAANADSTRLDGEVARLSEQYKAIIQQAWEAQTAFTGIPPKFRIGVPPIELPSALDQRLGISMATAEKGDPRAAMSAFVRHNIRESAGGVDLVYRNPSLRDGEAG